jgi:histidine triad (HIT) family protein
MRTQDLDLGYSKDMENCIFCSIANGDPSKLVWSNDVAAAFNDLHPKAPIHILVVPKTHVDKFDDLEDSQLAGQMVHAVRMTAEASGLKGAYKIIVNNGKAAGQMVDHLHFHILGGHKVTLEDATEVV